jgi:hypothetical protein
LSASTQLTVTTGAPPRAFVPSGIVTTVLLCHNPGCRAGNEAARLGTADTKTKTPATTGIQVNLPKAESSTARRILCTSSHFANTAGRALSPGPRHVMPAKAGIHAFLFKARK